MSLLETAAVVFRVVASLLIVWVLLDVFAKVTRIADDIDRTKREVRAIAAALRARGYDVPGDDA